MEGSRKKLAINEYQILHRQYCYRYKLNPLTAKIPKAELIADSVFVKKEADGNYHADRNEAVLSAIYYLIEVLVASRGIELENINRVAGNVEAIKPRRYNPNQEDIDQRNNEQNRHTFSRWRARLSRNKNK